MNRSEMMSRIRSKNTKPEICLRKILKGTYLRQHPKIFGKPDFGLTSKKIVVFVDGCFWHKCASCYKEPTTRKEFWISKMEKNVQRDKKVNRELKKLNYKVIRIWEHELKFDEQKVRLKMLRLLK